MLLATYVMQSSSFLELVVRISRVAFNLSSDKQNKLMVMVSISGLFLSIFFSVVPLPLTQTHHTMSHILFKKDLSGIYLMIHVKSKCDLNELYARKYIRFCYATQRLCLGRTKAYTKSQASRMSM